ncbi:hypothetical protein HDU93_006588 [Gonapodya sp. JEL0774]|nr:hypothetical protein HDU93_006588 [Gonapodya sp. JEL0774]
MSSKRSAPTTQKIAKSKLEKRKAAVLDVDSGGSVLEVVARIPQDLGMVDFRRQQLGAQFGYDNPSRILPMTRTLEMLPGAKRVLPDVNNKEFKDGGGAPLTRFPELLGIGENQMSLISKPGEFKSREALVTLADSLETLLQGSSNVLTDSEAARRVIQDLRYDNRLKSKRKQHHHFERECEHRRPESPHRRYIFAWYPFAQLSGGFSTSAGSRGNDDVDLGSQLPRRFLSDAQIQHGHQAANLLHSITSPDHTTTFDVVTLADSVVSSPPVPQLQVKPVATAGSSVSIAARAAPASAGAPRSGTELATPKIKLYVRKADLRRGEQYAGAGGKSDFVTWKWDVRKLQAQWERGEGLTAPGFVLMYPPRVLHAARRAQRCKELDICAAHVDYLKELNVQCTSWVKNLTKYGKLYEGLKLCGFDTLIFQEKFGSKFNEALEKVQEHLGRMNNQ